MDGGEIAVGLAKALAWPAVVGGAVVILRTRLGELLGSLVLRKLAVKAPGGFEATVDAPDPRHQPSAPVNDTLTKPAAAVGVPVVVAPGPNGARLPPSERPAVNLVEERLLEEVRSVAEGDRVPVLVRALSLARLEAAHATVYSRIFGSQIAGLRKLNPQGRVPLAEARAFFQSYAEQLPPAFAQNGFDNWLGFLQRSGLILRDDGTVEISPLGRDFLSYLSDRGLSEERPW